MAPHLSIFWGDKLVGRLYRHTRGRVQFEYETDWLENIGQPISFSLPCREEKFAPGISTAFFENLLPESDSRSIIAMNYRFDKNDTYAFLNNFGHDCAGALSIIPEDESPDLTPGQYRNITQDLIKALNGISTDPGRTKLYPSIKGARLSIAGAQDKLPIYFKNNEFFLPTNSGSATTHIIKPASPSFHGIQRNEAFCMNLAQKAGFDVPDSRLAGIENHELFIIERYDRILLPDRIGRIHQEDFCQATGIGAKNKYQESGGPGFKACREMIDEHLPFSSSEIRIDITALAAFNFLIGNHDAHGKNFSVIHGEEVRMAPFYDLLSTQVYPDLVEKFAMSIGQTYRHERVGPHSLELLADHMKLRPGKLAAIFNDTIRKVENSYIKCLSNHEKEYGSSQIYNDLEKVIAKNLTRLEQIISSF